MSPAKLLWILSAFTLSSGGLFAKAVDRINAGEALKELKRTVDSFSEHHCFDAAAKRAIEVAHQSAASKRLEPGAEWLDFAIHQFGISASDRILVSISLQQRWKGDEKGEGGLGDLLSYKVKVSQDQKKKRCTATEISELNDNEVPRGTSH